MLKWNVVGCKLHCFILSLEPEFTNTTEKSCILSSYAHVWISHCVNVIFTIDLSYKNSAWARGEKWYKIKDISNRNESQ